MTNPVATVIRCGRAVRQVYATLVSAERQTLGRGEIVLVLDDATPSAAYSWLDGMAQQRGLLLVRSPRRQPGAARNAGVQATMAPFLICLDAGDRLARDSHELGAAILAARPEVGIVSSPVYLLRSAGNSHIVAPAAFDLEGLVANPEAVHSASMFRREAWAALEGFDESLGALDTYEFWLRAVSAGYRCEGIPQPALIREACGDSSAPDRSEEVYVAAFSAICEKHIDVFRRHAPSALHSRERLGAELMPRYQSLVATRDAALREIEDLKRREGELRLVLSRADGEGIELGDFRRTTPIDRNWGYERGTPVDRHYIETFLEAHAADIAGVVLEIQEAEYTRRFGRDRVTESDVVDVNPGNPNATIISDLRHAANLLSDRYDCIILTQTLHVIDDLTAAVAECRRILKPGGVLLLTMPCASRLCLEYGPGGDPWRMTEAGVRVLLEPWFPVEALEIRSYGNVFSSAAFLYGMARHELTTAELDVEDPFFPLVIAARARKIGRATVVAGHADDRPGAPRRAPAHDSGARAVVLLYHRVGDAECDVHNLTVSRSAFHDQMWHLTRICQPVGLEELVTTARAGRLPSRAVAVTFDDGYLDNYTTARPILTALGVPATFFVTTDRLDGEPEFWWDTLIRALLPEWPHRPPELLVTLPEGLRIFPTATAAERLAAHWAIYRAISRRPAAIRDDVVAAVRRWSGVSVGGHPLARRMNGEAIRELDRSVGCSIGAHTVRHQFLPRQPANVQWTEIQDSRRALERLLGRRVNAFAYPFGAWSAATVDAVRAAAFEVAVTFDEERVRSTTDSLRVPRYAVTSERAGNFARWLDTVFAA